QGPVVREACGPGRLANERLLFRVGIEGDPVDNDHDSSSCCSWIDRTASRARRAADRRLYRRAQNKVRTSVMSRTRSSAISIGSMTIIDLPVAAKTASRYSKPNRI